jgi:hypothetical protein
MAYMAVLKSMGAFRWAQGQNCPRRPRPRRASASARASEEMSSSRGGGRVITIKPSLEPMSDPHHTFPCTTQFLLSAGLALFVMVALSATVAEAGKQPDCGLV